jgi:hypothetical protein
MIVQVNERRDLSGKTKLNYAVDLVTLLLILAMVGTGIVIRYILPPGSGGHGGGERWLLWGLDRHDWGGLHFWLAASLASVLLVHMILHWKWVCGVTRRWIGRIQGRAATRSRRTAYGVAFLVLLVALVGGFTWWCGSSVEILPGEEHGHGRHSLSPGETHVTQAHADVATSDRTRGDTEHSHPTEGVVVRGNMTLSEVARESGLTVNWLKERLGLPMGVSANERLGRLKRRFGFEIDDVRRAIARQRRPE